MQRKSENKSKKILEDTKEEKNPDEVKKQKDQEKKERIKQQKKESKVRIKAAKLAALPEVERNKRLLQSQRAIERQNRCKEIKQRRKQAKEEGRLEEIEEALKKEEQERKEVKKKEKLQRESEYKSKKASKKLKERLATLPEAERKNRILRSQNMATYHKKVKEKKQKEEQQKLQEVQEDIGSSNTSTPESIFLSSPSSSVTEISEEIDITSGVPIPGEEQENLQEFQGDTVTSILPTLESTLLSPLQSSVIESSEEQVVIDIEDWGPMFEVLLSDLSTEEDIDWGPIISALEKEAYTPPKSVASCEDKEEKVPDTPESMPPLESSEDEEELYSGTSSVQRLPQASKVSGEPPPLPVLVEDEENDDNESSTSPPPKKRLKTMTSPSSQGSLRSSHKGDTTFIPGYNHEAQLSSLLSLQYVLGGTIEQTSTKLKNLVLHMSSHTL